MLEAKALTCIRDERELFSGLSFSVQGGEVVQVAGHNGAGKTSLLRILSGLARPDNGQVFWQGELISRARDIWHRNLLWLGHQSGVKSVMTPDENLRFYHPHSTRQARWQALEEVELLGYEDVPVAQMSAGQQRRVALARMWLSDAALWILDEPFTALDVAGIEKLTVKMEQHVGRGGAVILTTHQPLRALVCPLRSIRLTAGEVVGQ
ncbi:cytochrome c biogenesis heme-transporting ATPase CcmA [Entomohabitans teleogrylli]|uniref:cytochrome c biogenesis heme-transporting ATPase CcmA n=1 Tax=Entomohabitans teleogrylli TaxID=1384589 RepID=UPI00073D6860|nr:cytochrome c biogenesis heme-transporting ATPase CcmA [Entomohabitans teleogrylli]